MILALFDNPFYPVNQDGFFDIDLGQSDPQFESFGIQGVTIMDFSKFTIFTPDTPDGKPMVIRSNRSSSWINIASRGVHGALNLISTPIEYLLGPQNESYYVSTDPFKTRFGEKESYYRFEFISSAVYNVENFGYIELDGPSQTTMKFQDMHFTSTSHNTGASIDLSSPVTLDYWGVSLVQEQGFSSAGLVCIKTGQIILTAAGIYEPRHFSQPFFLTWGEILSSGDIGRLFFDYNTRGQQFDGFNYTPSRVRLSEYDPSDDGYLHVGGTIHFDFFGSNYLNILDHNNPTETDDPWNERSIDLAFNSDHGFQPSDVQLDRWWARDLGEFDFKFQYDVGELSSFADPQMGIIVDGGTESEIRAMSHEKGHGSLFNSGIERMADGLTTAEEVLRVTFADSNT